MVRLTVLLLLTLPGAAIAADQSGQSFDQFQSFPSLWQLRSPPPNRLADLREGSEALTKEESANPVQHATIIPPVQSQSVRGQDEIFRPEPGDLQYPVVKLASPTSAVTQPQTDSRVPNVRPTVMIPPLAPQVVHAQDETFSPGSGVSQNPLVRMPGYSNEQTRANRPQVRSQVAESRDLMHSPASAAFQPLVEGRPQASHSQEQAGAKSLQAKEDAEPAQPQRSVSVSQPISSPATSSQLSRARVSPAIPKIDFSKIQQQPDTRQTHIQPIPSLSNRSVVAAVESDAVPKPPPLKQAQESPVAPNLPSVNPSGFEAARRSPPPTTSPLAFATEGADKTAGTSKHSSSPSVLKATASLTPSPELPSVQPNEASQPAVAPVLETSQTEPVPPEKNKQSKSTRRRQKQALKAQEAAAQTQQPPAPVVEDGRPELPKVTDHQEPHVLATGSPALRSPESPALPPFRSESPSALPQSPVATEPPAVEGASKSSKAKAKANAKANRERQQELFTKLRGMTADERATEMDKHPPGSPMYKSMDVMDHMIRHHRGDPDELAKVHIPANMSDKEYNDRLAGITEGANANYRAEQSAQQARQEEALKASNAKFDALLKGQPGSLTAAGPFTPNASQKARMEYAKARQAANDRASGFNGPSRAPGMIRRYLEARNPAYRTAGGGLGGSGATGQAANHGGQGLAAPTLSRISAMGSTSGTSTTPLIGTRRLNAARFDFMASDSPGSTTEGRGKVAEASTTQQPKLSAASSALVPSASTSTPPSTSSLSGDHSKNSTLEAGRGREAVTSTTGQSKLPPVPSDPTPATSALTGPTSPNPSSAPRPRDFVVHVPSDGFTSRPSSANLPPKSYIPSFATAASSEATPGSFAARLAAQQAIPPRKSYMTTFASASSSKPPAGSFSAMLAAHQSQAAETVQAARSQPAQTQTVSPMTTAPSNTAAVTSTTSKEVVAGSSKVAAPAAPPQTVSAVTSAAPKQVVAVKTKLSAPAVKPKR